MKESKLQSKIITWLKQKGCYVIKPTPGMGVPTGCPDVIALIDGGGWLALEVKANSKSKFQPLQKETIAKLNNMYYCRAVWDTNWGEIKKEIELII